MLVIELSFMLKYPLCFQMAKCIKIQKGYLEFVDTVNGVILVMWKALLRAISFACCLIVCGGKEVNSMMASSVTTVYPTTFWPYDKKELPSL